MDARQRMLPLKRNCDIWNMRSGKLVMAGFMLLATQCMAMGQLPVSTPVGPEVQAPPLLRMGLIADAQYCDCDASLERYYRISLEKLHTAVDTFNARQVDLVVNLGDLIDKRLESYPPVLQEIGRLRMPVYHLLGNHEFWDVPYHMQRSLYDSLRLQGGYCELEFPSWRLLLLDGTELAEYAQGAHPDLELEGERCRNSLIGHGNAAVWNGAVGEAQMEWMEWQLTQAAHAGQQVALFCHFPISPPGHPMSLWNEADLRVLLARHPQARAWFAGHSHQGGYMHLQGLHHLTLVGMLMTPDSNAFAILNFYTDHIVVEGFGREPYRVLPMPGSHLAPVTCLPDTLPPPDAVPPPGFPCLHRRVVDALGRVILVEDQGGTAPPDPPRLKPGCYGIQEMTEGAWQMRRHVVLPVAGQSGQ